MSPLKISDEDLLLALMKLFQEQGFDGVSLTQISEATKLKRSSLYHRFPGGKTDMALAVIEFSHKQFVEEVLAPLFKDGPAKARIRATTRNMMQFYEGGSNSCLMDALSVGSQSECREAISRAISAVFENLIEIFAKVAQDTGISRTEARRRGEDAMVQLEGSLVLARTTGDTGSFKRALKKLPGLLLGDD